jgi:hypothetical protein
LEVRREIQAAQLRQHDRRNDAVFLAWQVERIRLSTKVSQSGKRTMRTIVELNAVLAPEPGATTTQQSEARLRGTLHALAGHFGGRIRRRRG